MLAPRIENIRVPRRRHSRSGSKLVRRNGPSSDTTVQEVMERYDLTVVEHRPSDGAVRLSPPLSTPLRAGDGLIVQGLFERVLKVGEEVMHFEDDEGANLAGASR